MFVSRFLAALAPRTRPVAAGVAVAGLVAVSALLPVAGNGGTASAAISSSTKWAATWDGGLNHTYSTTRSTLKQMNNAFLTLPFEATSRMSVLSGWYYSHNGGFHGGIDFINGSVDHLVTWRTFAVIAAADGEACGNCSSRQGNAVWVKHNINGQTYYTYYGHLASIAAGIPLGSQSRTVHVTRGQFLGWAGDTGARGVLHLHFGLYNASSRPLDPYGIGRLRQYYPAPGNDTPGVGYFR